MLWISPSIKYFNAHANTNQLYLESYYKNLSRNYNNVV